MLAPLLGPQTAAAATPPKQVVLALVPDSAWYLMPPAFDGFAKASLAVAAASGGHREGDSYLTISKGGRSSGLGVRYGTGPMTVDGDTLTILDWKRFVAHDKGLRFGGHLGTLGQAVEDAHVSSTVITNANTSAAMVLADRRGIVHHAVLGGGALDVEAAVGRGTRLVVAETSVDALPLVLRAAGGACVVVASVSMPPDRSDLGAIAISPACGLGTGRLVSASTRQPDYVVLADLLPTTLELLHIDRDEPDEAAAITATAGHRSVERLIDLDRRSRVTGRAGGYFSALAVAGALIGLFATQMTERRRRRYAAWLLALPVSMLLINLLPWWHLGVPGGLVLSVALAAALGGLATVLFGRSPRILVAVLAVLTAVVLGIDASTGGKLELDSVVANNAIGAGRFSGMGNVPYGFFLAACILAAGLALDRWGRRAVVPLIVGFAAAVLADGAPSLGSDVGGVLAAVPAFALLVFGWRRSLPMRRLAMIALSGVFVLAAFAAIDVSRPAAHRTHLGRTLTNGVAVSTFVRRELNALKSFQSSPWCVVLLVGLAGLLVTSSQLPSSRPMRVMLGALGVGAFLGTFLNDSGVSVAGALTAVAWPAYLMLIGPPTVRIVRDSGGRDAPRPPIRRSGSGS